MRFYLKSHQKNKLEQIQILLRYSDCFSSLSISITYSCYIQEHFPLSIDKRLLLGGGI